jgi:hypothetical protein
MINLESHRFASRTNNNFFLFNTHFIFRSHTQQDFIDVIHLEPNRSKEKVGH